MNSEGQAKKYLKVCLTVLHIFLINHFISLLYCKIKKMVLQTNLSLGSLFSRPYFVQSICPLVRLLDLEFMCCRNLKINLTKHVLIVLFRLCLRFRILVLEVCVCLCLCVCMVYMSLLQNI